MRKTNSLVLIGLGALNVLHASLHIVQFLQSMILVKDALKGHDEGFLHSPYIALLWVITGVFTLYMGVKDYQHHHNHDK